MGGPSLDFDHLPAPKSFGAFRFLGLATSATDGRTGGVGSHAVVGLDVVFALLGRDYLPSTSVARRLGTGATGVRFVP